MSDGLLGKMQLGLILALWVNLVTLGLGSLLSMASQNPARSHSWLCLGLVLANIFAMVISFVIVTTIRVAS